MVEHHPRHFLPGVKVHLEHHWDEELFGKDHLFLPVLPGAFGQDLQVGVAELHALGIARAPFHNFHTAAEDPEERGDLAVVPRNVSGVCRNPIPWSAACYGRHVQPLLPGQHQVRYHEAAHVKHRRVDSQRPKALLLRTLGPPISAVLKYPFPGLPGASPGAKPVACLGNVYVRRYGFHNEVSVGAGSQ